MIRCPSCNGAGTVDAFWDGVDTGGKRIGGYGPVTCFTCNGTGEVDKGYSRRLEEGRRRRQDRLDRGMSLREEARRLGITAQELSRIEHGRS
jgi:DNA-directed RNA polymerase subunit N (RpoN/RPB10)